jgi:hypothetical protein
MSQFTKTPQYPSDVSDLQLKIDILKWIKSAKVLLPSLPNSLLRSEVENRVNLLLGSGVTVADLQEEITELKTIIERKDCDIAKLTRQVTELERCESELVAEQSYQGPSKRSTIFWWVLVVIAVILAVLSRTS